MVYREEKGESEWVGAGRGREDTKQSVGEEGGQRGTEEERESEERGVDKERGER